MENDQDNNRCVNPFWSNIIKWFQAKISKDEYVIPAYDAYVKATYGEHTDVEGQIRYHQHRINSIIKEKITNNYDRNNFSYRCVYSFPNNMAQHTDRVLQKFIDNGYQVINLSQRVEELKSDNVFLISWYKDKL